MDISGAVLLRVRIEQQEQWESAPAVQDGSQPHVDPDLDALRELRPDERLYETDAGSFAKRLTDGAWTFEGRGPDSPHPMGSSSVSGLGMRIEQQEQWRRAPAVNDGSQSPVDPDSHLLRALRYNERIYEDHDGIPFTKRIIDGHWARPMSVAELAL